MLTVSAFARTAELVGDPARANMLAALMDGRALTAKELASVAGVMPQTASGHLGRLTEAGLLAVEKQGRHRYHRLASPAVAHMLETIMSVSIDLDGPRKTRLVTGPRDQAMRQARTCYDHLAGRLGVGIADSLAACGHIELSPDGAALTESGLGFLQDLGVALEAPAGRRSARVFCRPCLDWSERRPHIAGVVGAALCQCCFAKGWVRRVGGTRAVTMTRAGEMALGKAFGVARMAEL